MAATPTPEHQFGPSSRPSGEPKFFEEQKPASIEVSQPRQSQKLEKLLEEVDAVVTEPEQSGPGEHKAMTAGKGGSGQKSLASSSLQKQEAPLPESEVMQQKLNQRIEQEITILRKEANKTSHLKKPGAANKISKLYARIRNLRRLLADISSASYEVVKRLFVRIFINKQPLI